MAPSAKQYIMRWAGRCKLTVSQQQVYIGYTISSGADTGHTRIGYTQKSRNFSFLVLPKSMKSSLVLVTHQCSYLCHIIQTVENILPCFLRLNPRLCLMIIWCLLKTRKRHWAELLSNQLYVMCHFHLTLHLPYPDLIGDHCTSLAWANTFMHLYWLWLWW